MWIFTGTGNANFYYALNIAYALGHVLLLADTILNTLKRDHESKKSHKD
jgi:hypothetical protein